jgi:hypothetical protein
MRGVFKTVLENFEGVDEVGNEGGVVEAVNFLLGEKEGGEEKGTRRRRDGEEKGGWLRKEGGGRKWEGEEGKGREGGRREGNRSLP